MFEFDWLTTLRDRRTDEQGQSLVSFGNKKEDSSPFMISPTATIGLSTFPPKEYVSRRRNMPEGGFHIWRPYRGGVKKYPKFANKQYITFGQMGGGVEKSQKFAEVIYGKQSQRRRRMWRSQKLAPGRKGAINYGNKLFALAAGWCSKKSCLTLESEESWRWGCWLRNSNANEAQGMLLQPDANNGL